jgi:hypothetical protein
MAEVQSYPLFDTLVEQVEKRVDKSIDIRRLCTTINGISQSLPPDQMSEHYREIAAIIFHYGELHGQHDTRAAFPFDGKIMVGGKGILFYITNFPPDLQQIIAQYVEEAAKV